MKMLLLGDVCPTNATAEIFREKDMDTLFGRVTELFKDKDYAFVNLECALTDSDGTIRKFGPHLKAPTETAEVLKSLGVDCCGLSNNHVFDFGKKGIKDTIDAITKSGLSYTGFGADYEDARRNFIVEKEGEKIALIAVCEHEYSYALPNRMGSRPYDEYDTMEDIRKAKAECDRVIVFYHGGKEFCRYPSPRLHKLCRAMIKNGADVVLCQHSHCIGCYEHYEGGHILYGQGNFHFVKFHNFEGWSTCLAVRYDTKLNQIDFVPIESNDTGVDLCDEKRATELLGAFGERNQSLKDGSWIEGWRAFCEENREYYTKAVADAFTPNSTEKENSVISHYLDCEAHTDVWREIFPTYNLTNCIDED